MKKIVHVPEPYEVIKKVPVYEKEIIKVPEYIKKPYKGKSSRNSKKDIRKFHISCLNFRKFVMKHI